MFIKSSSEINFFFIGICIICLSFSVEGRDLIGEITKLAKEERELNEKLIRTMTFELAETQNTIAGNSEKYLVKDTENNLWSFKTNTQREVENAKIVSDLAQLLGVSVPVLKGVALPINGREVFGSIQKIGFYDILRKKKPFIKEMTPGEILSLQKLQVFDWLVVMRPGEMYEHCFIISKTGDKMLAIDRDDGFANPKHGRILKMEEADWRNSLYARFWDSYLNKEINVNFKEVFELINYIQHIKNEEFKNILFFLEPEHKEEILEEILWRKANLKNEFKKFYGNLLKKRGEVFPVSFHGDYKNYLTDLLKKSKERIASKKIKYELLIKKTTKQKNIEVISSRKIWKWICALFEEGNNSIILQEIIEKAQIMEKNCSFVSERLAIVLYIRQLKTKQKLNISRIIKHPKRLNPVLLESNLRMNNYNVFLNNKDRKTIVFKKNGSILDHLRYIDIMKIENRNEKLISEYREKLKTNPNNNAYLFLSAMSQVKYDFDLLLNKQAITNSKKIKTFLKKLDNQFSWKYYGFALCDYGGNYIQEGIKNCEKTIHFNNDKEAVFAAYMLLGLFYEHNSKNVRFGEGFDIDKAITNYKKAIKINCDSIEAYLKLANLYLIKESPKKALKNFKKAKKINHQYAKEYLHIENIKGKRAYENKEKYLDTIRMNTLSGEEHYILGLAYMVKGQVRLAQKHFDKAREFGYKVDEEMKTLI